MDPSPLLEPLIPQQVGKALAPYKLQKMQPKLQILKAKSGLREGENTLRPQCRQITGSIHVLSIMSLSLVQIS